MDGDKLFALRTAVASRRPWWLLPIGAQQVVAPRPDTADSTPPRGQRFRCVLLQALDADDSATIPTDAAAAGISCQCVPPTTASPATAIAVVAEGNRTFLSIEMRYAAPTVCSEVVLTAMAPKPAAALEAGGEASNEQATDAVTDAAAPPRLPPFRLEVFEASETANSSSATSTRDREGGGAEGDGVWRLLHCQPMPTEEEMCNAGRSAVRCFLPHAVPVVAVPLPSSTGEAAPSAPSPLAGLLDADGCILRWPSKQKQQLLVVSYLALHLLPGRDYAEAEIDWLICTTFARSATKAPDCPTVRKEFERRGLAVREAGGGAFRAVPNKLDDVRSALQLDEAAPPSQTGLSPLSLA